MPVHIESDPAGERTDVVVRQDVGSLVVFVAFVLIIGIAASAHGREMGDRAWIWWPVGLGLAAVVWSLYAITAEERYVFARRDGTYEIHRRTVLGDRTVVSGTLNELRGVQTAWVGHDDSILGVAVSRRDGTIFTLPRRTSGLSQPDQALLASAIEAIIHESSAAATS